FPPKPPRAVRTKKILPPKPLPPFQRNSLKVNNVGRRGDGQEFARLEGKENDENIHYCNFGWIGYNCFGARVQSTDRAAKTGASNGDAATDVTTARRRGSRSAGISTWWQPAPDAQSVGTG